MVKSRLIAALLVVVFGVFSLSGDAWATAASGAATDRGVFTLTSQGAAKVATAEAAVGKAAKWLGMVGRGTGYLGAALVLYEIGTDVWDWWHQDYDFGTYGSWGTASDGLTWGVQSTSGYTGMYYGYGYFLNNGTFSCTSAWPGTDVILMGMRATPSTGTCYGTPYVMMLQSWYYPFGSFSPAVQLKTTGVDRTTMVNKIDQAVSDIVASQTARGAAGGSVPGQEAGTLAMLEAARNALSNGVALGAGDYSQGAGWSAGNPGTAGNSRPDALPDVSVEGGAEESSPLDLSGITSAISSLSSVITSAASTAASSVVSAVQAVGAQVAAIPTAISAAQAAIISGLAGVQAAVGTIPATIAASMSSALSALATGIEGVWDEVVGLRDDMALEAELAEDEAAASQPQSAGCPTCSREDKWSDLWGQIRTAGMGAPIFLLLNNLVINPSGTVVRQTQAGTAHFGTLEFNLSTWGVDTWISVLRYCVLFSAVVVAYMIIFA